VLRADACAGGASDSDARWYLGQHNRRTSGGFFQVRNFRVGLAGVLLKTLNLATGSRYISRKPRSIWNSPGILAEKITRDLARSSISGKQGAAMAIRFGVRVVGIFA